MEEKEEHKIQLIQEISNAVPGFRFKASCSCGWSTIEDKRSKAISKLGTHFINASRGLE